jgi:two-component system OmpR family sensor kinase
MIRRRLLAAIVTALTVITALTGTIVVSVLENRLISTVDEQLSQMADLLPRLSGTFLQDGHQTTGLGVEYHAVVKVGPDGKIHFQIPSGSTDNPDPLPDVTGLTTASAPVTLPSTGGAGPDYRAIAVKLPDGSLLIAAIPLTDVETTLATVRTILIVAGTGALAVAAALVWLSIRRGLRPINHMIDAAKRIAGGDLAARTTTTHPATEVGQLSTALNTMLDRIEQAMATKAESEARMRRFVADASHELATPAHFYPRLCRAPPARGYQP